MEDPLHSVNDNMHNYFLLPLQKDEAHFQSDYILPRIPLLDTQKKSQIFSHIFQIWPYRSSLQPLYEYRYHFFHHQEAVTIFLINQTDDVP